MNPERLEELLERWHDGDLSDDEQAELMAWLQEDAEHMQQFVNANVQEQTLFDAANSVFAADQIEQFTVAQHRDRTWQRSHIWLAAGLAACLLIAVAWFLRSKPQPGKIDTFISVVAVADATWYEAADLQVGDRLAAQTIRLESGFVRLLFDDGAEVTLQGPVEYELLEPGKTRLNKGLLTATIADGAQGFQVETPTAQVTDLGTSFGIRLDQDGAAHVSVFSGEVDVARRNSQEQMLLQEGETVFVVADSEIQQESLDEDIYAKIWPVSSGIAKSSDVFRFVPPWPPQLRFVRSDKDIFIAPETYGVTLRSPVQVNISAPGEYRHEDELETTEIESGTRVRSFMLFFHPEQGGPRVPDKHIQGSITFDSPILGIIVLHEELQNTSRRFGRFGPRMVQLRHQLELTGDNDGDVVRLSDDRRTLTLDLTTLSRFAEIMRVIVDASHNVTE